MQKIVPDIKFNQGLPSDYGSQDGHMLCILDDLMSECEKSPNVLNAFTRTSHHRYTSIILLVQEFFSKKLRRLTLNSKYLIVMRNPRDSSYVNILGRQMNQGKKNVVLESAFKDILDVPYSYIFIDLSQRACKYRIKSSLFPDSNCTVYGSNE